MPISAGRRRGGTRCRARKPSAARACRLRSTPPAPKSGAPRTSPSASARCLTLSAIEALDAHGSEELKKIYLEKLVSGEWTGTMQLTEPQAGSDVGALRTRAERAGDGSYRIKGTKIFITYGDHDMTDNIVHFVLARLPDAPAGTKGISLFLIPKFLVNADGSLGAQNDIYPSGVEHKLGMHASPTCTMTMGDKGGAIGYLIGEENRGMLCMFTMMNQARLGVGLEGVGIADRAYQQALAYAQERRQGRAVGSKSVRHGRHHRASRRQAHADADARHDGRRPHHLLRHRGGAGCFRARQGRQRCAPMPPPAARC